MVRPIVLWTASILLGLMFVLSGATKFMVPTVPEKFAQWGYPSGFHFVVGGLEVLGGLLLLVPRTAFSAAVLLAVLMAGAVYTHLVPDQSPASAILPATFLIALVTLALARRPRAGGTPS